MSISAVVLLTAAVVGYLYLRDHNASKPEAVAPTQPSGAITAQSPAAPVMTTTARAAQPPATIQEHLPPQRSTANETVGIPGLSPGELAVYDAQFVQGLRTKWNWIGGTPEGLAANAHLVCLKLRQGEDLPQISREYSAALGVDPSSAHVFASEALLTYPNCHG